MRFFDTRYRVQRRLAIALFFVVLGLGIATLVGDLSREASGVLRAHRAQEWLAVRLRRADEAPFPALQKLSVLLTYWSAAVVPAVRASAGPHHWLLALGYLVASVVVPWVVFKKAADWSDRRRDRPAVGRWASSGEVLRKFSTSGGEPSVYFGLYSPPDILRRVLRRGRPYELRMPMRTMVENVVVVGGIGAGKSWGLLIPMIASAADDPRLSVVAVDIKFGERDCLTTASRFWMNRGGRVVVWNPWDPNSVRIDILEGLTADSEDVWEHVAILMGHTPNQVSDQVVFWSTSEAVVMEVLLRSALMEGRHMDRVRDLSYQTPEALQKHIALLERADMRRKLDRFFGLGYDKQAGTLYGLEKYLRDWDNPTVVRATTPGQPGETFELRRILREHVMFVIGIPQEKFVSGQSLVLFRLLLKTLTKMLLSARRPGENQKVILVLEEFAQLERIPYFEQFLSSCRSRGVATVVTLQDVHRGYAVYGRDLFTGLLNNMRTVVLFPESLGAEEARYFSELMGQRAADSRSWSVGPDARVSLGERAQPLVPAEEMRWGWKKHEVLVSTSGIPPFRAWLPPAITRREFRNALLRLAPDDAVVPREDGGVDVLPPSMHELARHYRASVAAEAIREWASRPLRAESPAPHPDGQTQPAGPGGDCLGGEVLASALQTAEPPSEPAAAPERAAGEDVFAAGSGGGKAEEHIPGASGDGEVQASAAGAGSQPWGGSRRDGAHPAAAGSGPVTVKDLATSVLSVLVERIDADPTIVHALEVRTSRDRKSVEVQVPRWVLEGIFGDRLSEYLKAWMDMGWVEPVRGDRFRVTRSTCEAAPQSLRETFMRRVARARKAPDRPGGAGGAAVSSEAARKFVVLCQWVASNLHMFWGHPSWAGGASVAGIYRKGEGVGVLPHLIHTVTGGKYEENWPVWRQWVNAGWVEADGGRLTRLMPFKEDRRRVVWIVWDAYQTAAEGKVPEVRPGRVVQEVLDEAMATG